MIVQQGGEICTREGYNRSMSDRMSLPLAQADPEIAVAVENEIRRQHEGLEMIASENFVSRGCA